MNLLAVDTALGACSVALLSNGEIRAHRYEAMARGHAEALAPMVDEAMRESGLVFSDLDRLAVTTGPGTFTGQRVGLAFMRGLRVALGRPLVGLTTLEVMAAAASAEARTEAVAVLHEAKRGEVYGALFAGGIPIIPVQVATTEQMLRDLQRAARSLTEPLGLAGTGAEDAKVWLDGRGLKSVLTAVRQPDAFWVARLAETAPEPLEAARPLYLRAPDAKLAASAIRLRLATRDDAGHLAELHAATMPRAWEVSFFDHVLSMPGGFAIVAEAHGAALGFVFGRVVVGEAEILSIGVLAAYRQNRVGARLLVEAAARAHALGAMLLFLEVDENNRAARKLYESHGLTRAGRRKNYYGSEGGGDGLLLKTALPLETPDLGIVPKLA